MQKLSFGGLMFSGSQFILGRTEFPLSPPATLKISKINSGSAPLLCQVPPTGVHQSLRGQHMTLITLMMKITFTKNFVQNHVKAWVWIGLASKSFHEVVSIASHGFSISKPRLRVIMRPQRLQAWSRARQVRMESWGLGQKGCNTCRPTGPRLLGCQILYYGVGYGILFNP